LADRLKARTAIIPEHARTLSLETLRELLDRGVHIESHGWDHRDIVSLTQDELVESIRLTMDWFQTCLGIRPANFAVPYGLSPLPNRAVQEVPGMILLANPKLESGCLGHKHWNRRDITRSLQ